MKVTIVSHGESEACYFDGAFVQEGCPLSAEILLEDLQQVIEKSGPQTSIECEYAGHVSDSIMMENEYFFPSF